jgi:cysteinyl-tRNA synthetase
MLKIFNTLSNKEETFIPNSSEEVKIYACGPTVYDRPHLGNARSIVFYDILFRILSVLYPKVIYVRNITDVDDKILNRAKEEGVSPKELTERIIKDFHEDVSLLNCLPPTFEPKATEYIPQMLEMIETLVTKKHAYVGENGDVMFAVESFPEYGKLSNRKLSELNSGARISVSEFKKNDNDFVLWKKVESSEMGWESKFSYGRPGWHIECSAMSYSLLGMNFDIHGGGADLQFPHHENEIAQSECCFPGKLFAKYWVHNGFLTIDGEKMSKSLGNFKTVKNLLDEGYSGIEIRFALLNTHYRKPLSFSNHVIETAKSAIHKFNKTLKANFEIVQNFDKTVNFSSLPQLAQEAILDNINISKFTAIMHGLVNDIKNTNDLPGKTALLNQFYKMGLLIGIFS